MARTCKTTIMASRKRSTITLDGKSLTLPTAVAISQGAAISLADSVPATLTASRDIVKKKLRTHRPIYGVNTGFGFLANQAIPQSQLQTLQINILRSHASGHGAPLSLPETRLAMALRLNVLAQGYAGVRLELCQALHALLAANILPVIPELGSVGASGDLAPLAHLALPLIGEGEVHYQGRIIPAMQALLDADIAPITLAEKEGLALINGTQIMLAIGTIALAKGLHLLELADLLAALTFEGLQGNPEALDAQIHAARGQPGQIASAANMRAHLDGSYLHKPRQPFPRVQDPYSLRCAPQIHGASRDALTYPTAVIERELNATTDNPLVFIDPDRIVSGGNFHGQPLAIALDVAAIALSELGNVSERRLELMLNPHHSGLPAFLTSYPGLESGYMAAQYLAASLVNQNKLLANPASTDSIPGNVGIEDHVSMGMTSARKLRQLVGHLETILAIELMAAAQAIDLRHAHPLGTGTARAYQMLRSHLPKLTEDRIIANDVTSALEALHQL